MKQVDVLVIAASLALAGCGAAQLALRGPISNQCASRGLKGCPDLTDGVMEYVSGDKAVAEKKLRAGAAANNPEQLRQFATALEPIAANAGGDTGAAITAVIAILRGDDAGDTRAAKAGSASARAAAGAKPNAADAALRSPPPNVMVEELRAGTERPATDPRAATCGGIFGTDPKCTRVRVFVGPLVVTNAYTSGGCGDELFLTAGRFDDDSR